MIILSKQSGVTIVEAMIGTMLIGTLIAATLPGVYKASRNGDIATMTHNLMTLRSNIQQRWYPAANNSFSGVNNAQLIASELVPHQMIQGGQLRTIVGTNVTVSPYSTGFTITYGQLSSEYCRGLLQAVNTSFDRILANGVEVHSPTTNKHMIPINTISTSCNKASNGITWQMY